jgi:hypothetical protein
MIKPKFDLTVPMYVGEDFDTGKDVTLMFSLMNVGDLMKLRDFCDELIKDKIRYQPAQWNLS